MDENDGTCNSSIDEVFYAYANNINNPRMLSVEQLRKFKELEQISEELAEKIIAGLYKLSIITYKKYKNGNRTI